MTPMLNTVQRSNSLNSVRTKTSTETLVVSSIYSPPSDPYSSASSKLASFLNSPTTQHPTPLSARPSVGSLTTLGQYGNVNVFDGNDQINKGMSKGSELNVSKRYSTRLFSSDSDYAASHTIRPRNIRRVAGMRLLSQVATSPNLCQSEESDHEEQIEEDKEEEDIWQVNWRTKRRSGGSSPRVSIVDSESSLSEAMSQISIDAKWVYEDMNGDLDDDEEGLSGLTNKGGPRFLVSIPAANRKRSMSVNTLLFCDSASSPSLAAMARAKSVTPVKHLQELMIEAPPATNVIDQDTLSIRSLGRAKTALVNRTSSIFDGASLMNRIKSRNGTRSTHPPSVFSTTPSSTLGLSSSGRSKSLFSGGVRSGSIFTPSNTSPIPVMERMKSLSAKLSSSFPVVVNRNSTTLDSTAFAGKRMRTAKLQAMASLETFHSHPNRYSTDTTGFSSFSTLDSVRQQDSLSLSSSATTQSAQNVSKIITDFESKNYPFSLHQLIQFIILASSRSPHSLLPSSLQHEFHSHFDPTSLEYQQSMYEILQNADGLALAIEILEKECLKQQAPSLKRKPHTRRAKRLNSTTTSFHISPSRTQGGGSLSPRRSHRCTTPTASLSPSAVESFIEQQTYQLDQQLLLQQPKRRVLTSSQSRRNLTDASAVASLSISNHIAPAFATASPQLVIPPRRVLRHFGTQHLRRHERQDSATTSPTYISSPTKEFLETEEGGLLLRQFREAFQRDTNKKHEDSLAQQQKFNDMQFGGRFYAALMRGSVEEDRQQSASEDDGEVVAEECVVEMERGRSGYGSQQQ
ncbi:UNVERIFIED_CONTAM: hypothetical protein HDU68_001207 [Siphonaria sp. JEL0065]|nr:hypothetical protein HDU68_001207 [Siphonaria sp. JEL0065]